PTIPVCIDRPPITSSTARPLPSLAAPRPNLDLPPIGTRRTKPFLFRAPVQRLNPALASQQMPCLPISPVFVATAVRREMQRAVLPARQFIWNDVPGINWDQIHRKKIQHFTLIALTFGTHHI